MERRRRAEVYRRRQLEIGQLNRRRQYEHARRQAELQRQRQAEMDMEQEAIYQRTDEHRRSMMDGGMEDLLSMLYGCRATSTPTRDLSPLCNCGASSELVGRFDVTSMTAEDSAPASQGTSLHVESAEPRDASPTGLSSGTEVEVTETQETQKPDTAGSLAAVGDIVAMFYSLRSSFTFPSRLDFVSSSSCDSPKLAYTPNNAPLHQYEHVLTGLPTQLDAVESYGDERVRKARKEAVKQIEGELAGLDERKVDERKKQAMPEMEGEAALAENDVQTVDIDAAAVPLPDDTDDAEASTSSTPSTCGFPGSGTSALPSDPEISHVSLEEASSSDNSDSEVEDYVDVEADVTSDTGTEEMEKVRVERENDLAGLNEWDLDF
ncbi:hypothetical protein FRC12_022166 [Ceratobasidium sp. 428]|nr:hypothetical protein FRC12_022166 [Ceratobasidium sp. 428]